MQTPKDHHLYNDNCDHHAHDHGSDYGDDDDDDGSVGSVAPCTDGATSPDQADNSMMMRTMMMMITMIITKMESFIVLLSNSFLVWLHFRSNSG